MRVFLPFSCVLAMDIEAARREIPAMKEGEAEICVLGANMDDKAVANLFKDYPCISRVYTLNADGMRVHVPYERELCMCSWTVPANALRDGDWIYARSAPAATIGLIAPYIVAVSEPAVVYFAI